VLRITLRHLDAWNAQPRERTATYDRLLAIPTVGLTVIAADRSHIYDVYVIRSTERDALRAVWPSARSARASNSPIPIRLQPATRELGYRLGDLPNTEQAAREVMSIPMYAEVTPDQPGVDRFVRKEPARQCNNFEIKCSRFVRNRISHAP